MDATLIKALQLVLSISLLVVLHEGGHFLFSKLFHVRVEKFFLFFDPYFHLFSTKDKWFTRLFPKFEKMETEYGIGWLPFGGYVKIAGMIDESMDTEQMKQPVQKWEFRAKPAWQRLFIMIGGVLVNFLLALFLYGVILFTWGKEYLPVENITQGFQYNEMAQKAGFRNGDIPIEADGVALHHYDGDFIRSFAEAKHVKVKRQDGTTALIDMPQGVDLLKIQQMQPAFIQPYMIARVDSVYPGTKAARAGMLKGARLVALDGTKLTTWADYDQAFAAKKALYDQADNDVLADSLAHTTLVFQNPGSDKLTRMSFKMSGNWLVGVGRTNVMREYTWEHREYGFFESIPAGVNYGLEVLGGYISDLKYVFTADGAKSVGSFITIGSIFPSTWNWMAFWEITAFLSIMLAIMNILPIPALDGGHVLFLIVEMILRRQPSEKFMERAQVVGMVLIMGLMLLACYNDIMRFLL